MNLSLFRRLPARRTKLIGFADRESGSAYRYLQLLQEKLSGSLDTNLQGGILIDSQTVMPSNSAIQCSNINSLLEQLDALLPEHQLCCEDDPERGGLQCVNARFFTLTPLRGGDPIEGDVRLQDRQGQKMFIVGIGDEQIQIAPDNAHEGIKKLLERICFRTTSGNQPSEDVDRVLQTLACDSEVLGVLHQGYPTQISKAYVRATPTSEWWLFDDNGSSKCNFDSVEAQKAIRIGFRPNFIWCSLAYLRHYGHRPAQSLAKLFARVLELAKSQEEDLQSGNGG